MSAYSDFSQAARQIYERQGQLAADAQRRRGDLIGGTIATLGQIPLVVQQQRQQDQALKAKQQQQQLENQLKVAEIAQRQQQLDQKGDPTEAAMKDLQFKLLQHEAVSRQLLNTNADNWDARRKIAINILGPQSQADFPEEYPGDAAIKAWVDEGASVKDQLEAQRKALEEKNKTPPLVPTVGPDGKPVYGVPKPGDPVYERPPATPTSEPLEQTVGPDGKPVFTPRSKAIGQTPYHPPPASSQNPAGEKLDPDSIDYVATQYRIFGPSGIPTRFDDQQKIPIINQATKQLKALGQTPAQAVQKQAAFKADASSLTKITNMKASAESYENKALAQADLVGDLSKKVGRTQYPIINGALLAGKQSIAGDQDTQLLFNALSTFTAEYAKIMEGSTGSAAASSDAARKAAASLISPALNKGTLQATIDQMKKEMRWTIQGYDATIERITGQMGGAPAAPAGGVLRYDPATGTVH